jgi:hypothetical protein
LRKGRTEALAAGKRTTVERQEREVGRGLRTGTREKDERDKNN